MQANLGLAGSHFDIGRADFVQDSADGSADLARFGMTPDFFLAEDAFAIDPDIKDAAGARDQFPTADVVFDIAFVQDFVRQTDGNGLVPSSGTILNDNFHSTYLHDARSLCFAAVDTSSIAK